MFNRQPIGIVHYGVFVPWDPLYGFDRSHESAKSMLENRGGWAVYGGGATATRAVVESSWRGGWRRNGGGRCVGDVAELPRPRPTDCPPNRRQQAAPMPQVSDIRAVQCPRAAPVADDGASPPACRKSCSLPGRPSTTFSRVSPRELPIDARVIVGPGRRFRSPTPELQPPCCFEP